MRRTRRTSLRFANTWLRAGSAAFVVMSGCADISMDAGDYPKRTINYAGEPAAAIVRMALPAKPWEEIGKIVGDSEAILVQSDVNVVLA